MSFRLFIYYCALCGGWAALGGWALGQAVAPADPLWRTVVLGCSLGLVLAFGLGLLDAWWNLSWRRAGALAGRALTALAVGAVGGACGGYLGYLLRNTREALVVIGWAFTGVLIGAAVATFEVATAGRDRAAAARKLAKCMLGGAAGGILGGGLYLGLYTLLAHVFSDKTPGELWSPTSWGFVALGFLIGLLVGLAQVILKEAWVKVEAGFRPGRELILAKESTSIGRAEGADIPLFGDQGVGKTHARILLDRGRYFLETAAEVGSTFLNDQPVHGRAQLQSGDQIRLGTRSVLCFFEKPKRK